MQKKSMLASLSALAVLTAALWAPQAGANDVIKIGQTLNIPATTLASQP